jgi:molybdopterin-guanine dinucleotide biosynthesis protein A
VTARCTGVVLAGGQATRYGGKAKGLERVAGVRVIDRVARALGETSDELLLIANDPEGASWLPGVRVERDVRAGCGSLGGIHAAIAHAAGERGVEGVLVVAWDMPFVPAGLLALMRRLGEDGADVVVPESGSRRGVEPLCAYYTPACLGPIERRLDAGDLRVIGFYDDVRVARVPVETVRTFGDPARLFMNINSPDELALAEQYASNPATAPAADGGDHRAQASR